MPFDAQAWISEMTEGLPKDKQAQIKSQLEGALADEALAKNVGASVLRQSDYSRNMDEIKKLQSDKQAELAKVEANLKSEYNRISNWHSSAQEDYNAKVKAAQEAQAERDRIQAAYERAADEAGFDPKDYLEGGAKPRARGAQDPPAIDTSKFVSREEVEKRIAAISRSATNWPVALMTLNQRHREVFGKDLSPNEMQDLLNKHTETKQALDDVWFDTHKVDEALETQRESKVKERIEAAVAEDRDKRLAESVSVPGAGDMPVPTSPVLRHSYEQAKKNGEFATQKVGEDGMTPKERAAFRFQRGDYARDPQSPRFKQPAA